MLKENMLCAVGSTLLDVLCKINLNGKGIAFIINEKNALIGVMTDGDIRQLLIRGIDLKEKVDKYLKKDFVSATTQDSYDDIVRKFDEKVHVIPIIDKNRVVVDYSEFSSKVRIPVAQPELHGNEFSYLVDAFLSTWISSTGEYVNKFERNFADYCSTAYGVAVTNGTTALHLALVALGIGAGDEVIIPDLTFAATINAVLHAQATPVIVDVEKDSWCICPKEIERAITANTKAIIPVHLYGQPCNMDAICDIAERYHLKIIEDCAEAHGAMFHGKKVGSFGDIGCFSFFGNKVITTGEGGMCVTDSSDLDNKMRILRDHGMSKEKKYYHDYVGFNYRMTNLQASIGVAQLERIDTLLADRERIENIYREQLKDCSYIQFQASNLEKRKKITWLVSVLIINDKRDEVMIKLKDNGIDVRPFFIPLSEMEIYKKYTFSNTNSVKISKKGINLPTTINMQKSNIKRIAELLLE